MWSLGGNFNKKAAKAYNARPMYLRGPTVPALPSRLYTLVFALIMSGLMSLLMSGVITFINTGFDGGFMWRWASAWVVAWVVAFPLVSVIAPLSHRLTRRFVSAPDA